MPLPTGLQCRANPLGSLIALLSVGWRCWQAAVRTIPVVVPGRLTASRGAVAQRLAGCHGQPDAAPDTGAGRCADAG